MKKFQHRIRKSRYCVDWNCQKKIRVNQEPLVVFGLQCMNMTLVMKYRLELRVFRSQALPTLAPMFEWMHLDASVKLISDIADVLHCLIDEWIPRAAAAVAQSVKCLGLRSLKRGATELT